MKRCVFWLRPTNSPSQRSIRSCSAQHENHTLSGGVAAVIAGIALSAISLGVLNIVGGILGGAVATVKVIWDITHAPDGKKWGQLSSTQKVAVVLKGALYIAGGTAAGVASSGVSAGVSLAAGVVTEVTLSRKPEVGKKTAIAGGLAVGLVVGAIAAAIVGDFGTVAEASAVAFAEIQPVLTEGFEAARVQQKQIRQKQKAVRASSAKVAGKKQANVRLKTVKTKPR